ncbi:MAG: AMP-binding protein, partial [Kordiimonas sp.]
MAVFDDIEKFGEAPAVIDAEGRTVSYIGLTELADKLCAHLPPRSIAVLKTSNSVGSIAAYVGCLRRGIVPILLPNGIKPEGLAEICAAYQPNSLFSPADETSSKQETIAGYKCVSLNTAATQIHDNLALLISTSGSTGSKTMVRLSAQNIACNANQIIEYLGIAQSDRVITTMPMSYSYGLSLINTHLLSGAAIVATDEPLMSPKFWSLLKEQKVTTFGGVPFIYEMLKKLRFNKMDLPSLRYLTQAGGKLSTDLSEYFMAACHQKSIDFTV